MAANEVGYVRIINNTTGIKPIRFRKGGVRTLGPRKSHVFALDTLMLPLYQLQREKGITVTLLSDEQVSSMGVSPKPPFPGAPGGYGGEGAYQTPLVNRELPPLPVIEPPPLPPLQPILQKVKPPELPPEPLTITEKSDIDTVEEEETVTADEQPAEVTEESTVSSLPEAEPETTTSSLTVSSVAEEEEEIADISKHVSEPSPLRQKKPRTSRRGRRKTLQ